MTQELKDKLQQVLKEAFEKHQELPNQFIVAYYKVKDDELIGYHSNSFCQTTQDILQAKRYSGENPYPQLKTISENLKYTLKGEHTGIFSEVFNHIRENDFASMNASDIYLDAIYLAEGMPKQDCKYIIVDNE